MGRDELAHQLLLQWIRTGKLRPGAPVNEGELAEAIGMSRTPLREALARLKEAGLVDAVPRRGVTIAELTVADVAEVGWLQDVLEASAADSAVSGISRENLVSLRENVDTARALVTSPSNLAELTELDYTFHHTIWIATGNGRLLRLMDNLYHAALLDRRRYEHRGFEAAFQQSLREHDAILNAIESGDVPATRRAMEAHRRWHDDPPNASAGKLTRSRSL